MKVLFRVNQTEVEILARPTGFESEWEPYALDRFGNLQVGEFNLEETDDIEWKWGDGPWEPCPLPVLYRWFNQTTNP